MRRAPAAAGASAGGPPIPRGAPGTRGGVSGRGGRGDAPSGCRAMSSVIGFGHGGDAAVAFQQSLYMLEPYLGGMDRHGPMELRHLRYFVAVAEEGSLTTAAERRLHTAPPALSRETRDLETEVGVKLLERGARAITLTAAGRTFLDHARLALLQVEAAGEAA